MTIRRRRRKNKVRGQRTHGKGDTKNVRGAGCKGGRGRAGSHKHKYSKFYPVFGKERRKVTPQKEFRPGKAIKAINLDVLQQGILKWVAQKKVEKSNSGFIIDGEKIGFNKILGKGEVREKLLIRNLRVSKKAKEKIIKAGGKIEEIREEKRRRKKKEEKEEGKEEKEIKEEMTEGKKKEEESKKEGRKQMEPEEESKRKESGKEGGERE